MSKYIKSHSNYVLEKKHQTVDGGKIYERDITTIGGLNQFAKGQTPIYQSSNFIITINNEANSSKNYISTKWEENEENGYFWTLDNITNESGKSNSDEDTTEIVIKQDFYSLRDFAYFGSCKELIRGSINDIVNRFPGELYAPSGETKVYYQDTSSSVTNATTEQLVDGDYQYLVTNPFGIDIHTPYMSEEDIDNELKYFCCEGFLNYQIKQGEGDFVDIKTWVVELLNPCENPKTKKQVRVKGEAFAKITINGNPLIEAFLGDESSIVYLSNAQDFHIRPKKEFLKEFYKSLDSFEKVLLNKESSPKYTATFEVLKENNFGFLNTLEKFTFPTVVDGYDRYNLDIQSGSFNGYVDRLAAIAEVYDEYFCDNVYRQMTHESIKNFDWSYTRHYTEGDEKEYVIGGTKIEKYIHLLGREFDEIKSYIDAMAYANVVKYGEGNNIPDYFLTDTVEVEGWDLTNIYPMSLKLYSIDENGKREKVDFSLENMENTTIFKSFEDIVALSGVTPYSNAYSDNPNGYFKMFKECGTDTLTLEEDCSTTKYFNKYSNGTRNVRLNIFCTEAATASSESYRLDTKVSNQNNTLRKKIKEYVSEKKYTMNDVNNFFLKTLKLNSRALLSRKGTIDGIEEILGLFGLKSKRFAKKYVCTKCGKKITEEEYQMLDSDKKCNKLYCDGKKCNGVFTQEKWDYEITEYVSTTKGIEDKYNTNVNMHTIDWINHIKTLVYDTDDYRSGVYHPYQGLPLKYYYKDDTDKTSPRYLFPYFDKNAIHDGNPYYQMNGGWLKKSPYVFDNNNNILSVETYTQTLRNVKSVNNLQELIALPIESLNEGDVYEVKDLSGDFLIVNGKTYEVFKEKINNNTYYYIETTVQGNSVSLGYNEYTNFITVSYPFSEDGVITHYLDGYNSGNIIKIYIEDNNITAYTDNNYSLQVDRVIDGVSQNLPDGEGYITNFFKLRKLSNKLRINNEGWEQLYTVSEDYKLLNTKIDYFKGNNPHVAYPKYDNGKEYINHFTTLFKYALENNEFDNRCLSELYNDRVQEYEDIKDIGFHGLDNNYSGCDDEYNILVDDKIHYFGNYKECGNSTSNDVIEFNANEPNTNNKLYDYNGKIAVNGISTKSSRFSGKYNALSTNVSYTEQIVNTKKIDIKFNLSNTFGVKFKFDSQDGVEIMKYYDTVILNYLTQMIPSTAIVSVKYE